MNVDKGQMRLYELAWELFNYCQVIDRSIGGMELVQMPRNCANLITGLKRRVSEINATIEIEAEFPGEDVPFDPEQHLSPLW